MGNDYVETLFRLFKDRLPGMADFCCYWHEKARRMVETRRTRRAGLLATQSIRGGGSRRVLERIKATGDIFLAWSDEPWVLDGATVHVSFVGFDDGSEYDRVLDGLPVAAINSNLTAGLDLGQAKRLRENRGMCFIADVKGGPFDITAELAESMLRSRNPDGRSNRDVVRPWVNALDVTGRSRGMYIIDFGTSMTREEAALYQAPYEYAIKHVLPFRTTALTTTKDWWRHERPGHSMRVALEGLHRYMVTPETAKHRLLRGWMELGSPTTPWS